MTSVEIEPYQQMPPATLFGTDDPGAIIERQTVLARTLADVVRSQRLVVKIGQSEHVRVEGWTFLGSLLGVFPIVVWTKPVMDGDAKVGWEARVEACTRSGEIVGAAEAECLRSESSWGRRDDYALRSMAQTRAVSKALRMPLGFVMQLAGFNPTPAEEMPPPEKPVPPPTPPPPPPKPATAAARKRMHALFREAGIDGRPERLAFSVTTIGRQVATSTDLTADEVKAVSKALEQATAPAAPDPVPDESHNPAEQSYTERRGKESATAAQVERLDDLVSDALEHRAGAIPDLWAQVAAYRKTMVADLIAELGVETSAPLPWAPLRDSLTRAEAGDLVDHLTAVRLELGLPEPDIPF